jgi:hypothetical protein
MLGFEAGYRRIYLLWHLIFALVSNDILGLASREKGEKKKKRGICEATWIDLAFEKMTPHWIYISVNSPPHPFIS